MPARAPTTTDATFTQRVLAVVRSIPVGQVCTYGDVATLAGRPRAHRAVGNIMRSCREPGVPCHRVIGAGGMLGGYSAPSLKRELLRAEGLVVVGQRVRGFSSVRWSPRRSRSSRSRRSTVRSTSRK